MLKTCVCRSSGVHLRILCRQTLPPNNTGGDAYERLPVLGRALLDAVGFASFARRVILLLFERSREQVLFLQRDICLQLCIILLILRSV